MITTYHYCSPSSLAKLTALQEDFHCFSANSTFVRSRSGTGLSEGPDLYH